MGTGATIRCSAALIFGALSLGCGTPQTPAVHVSPPTARPTADPWVAAALPAHPPRGSSRPIENGRYRWVQGVRIERLADRERYASDSTAFEVIGASHRGDEWLFVTNDGAAFRSIGFTGALDRVGDAARSWSSIDVWNDHPLEFARTQTSVVTVLDRSGALYIASPTRAPQRAPLPDIRRTIDALFASDDFGAAIVEPGVCFRTVDGGASFHRVALGTATAVALRPFGDANHPDIVIDTDDGPRLLLPSSDPRPDASIPPPPPATSDDWTSHWDPRLPSGTRFTRLLALAQQSGVLEDGRALAYGESASLVDVAGVAAPLDPPERCLLSTAGRDVYGLCCSDSQSRSELRRYTRSGWELVRRFDSCAHLIADPRGDSLLVTASCDGNDPSWCWYHGTWDPVAAADGLVPGDLRGDVVLLGQTRHPAREVWSTAYAVLRPGLPLEVVSPSPASSHPRIRFDGTSTTLNVTEGERSISLARGEPGREIRRVSLPRDTYDVSFVDASRGLASSGGQLLFTVDGGTSWHRITSIVDGDESTSIDRTSEVTCYAGYCAARDVIWGDPSIVGEPPRIVAALHPVTPFRPRGDTFRPWRAGGDERAWQCVLPAIPETPRRLMAENGWIDFHVGRPGSHGDLSWDGVDARGRFHASARRGALPPIPVRPISDADDGVDLVTPLHVGRRLTVMRRCARHPSRVCDIVAATDRGLARRVGLVADLAGFHSDYEDVVAAAGGDSDDRIALWFSANDNRHTVVVLSASGDVVSRKQYELARHTNASNTYLAHTASGFGLAVSSRPDRAIRFYPVDRDDEPVVLATLPADTVVPCVTERAADAATLHGTDDLEILVDDLRGSYRAVLETNGGSVCLRAAGATTSGIPSYRPASFVFRQGILEAHAFQERGETTVRCESIEHTRPFVQSVW